MATGKAKVKTAITDHTKEFSAAATAPFLFFHDHLRAIGLRYGGNLKRRFVSGGDAVCIQPVWAGKTANQLIFGEENVCEGRARIRLEGVNGVPFLVLDALEHPPGRAAGLDVEV